MDSIVRTAGGFAAAFLVYLVAGTFVGLGFLILSEPGPMPQNYPLLDVLVAAPTLATFVVVVVLTALLGLYDPLSSPTGTTNLAVVDPLITVLPMIVVLVLGTAGFFAWRTRSAAVAWMLAALYVLECLAVAISVLQGGP